MSCAEEWRALGETLRAADLVTCDSADLAQTIRASLGVDAERIAIVQWGVDTSLFHPEGPDRRTELGLAGRDGSSCACAICCGASGPTSCTCIGRISRLRFAMSGAARSS